VLPSVKELDRKEVQCLEFHPLICLNLKHRILNTQNNVSQRAVENDELLSMVSSSMYVYLMQINVQCTFICIRYIKLKMYGTSNVKFSMYVYFSK
jgi:hypothetical protein